MDEIKKEYDRGWNEAIEAARKVAEELKEREVEAGCDYLFPPACYDEIAESIGRLKK